MAEVNFDEIKQGMSMLEVVRAYQEYAVKAMEKMQAELAQLSHNSQIMPCPRCGVPMEHSWSCWNSKCSQSCCDVERAQS